jgi:hypothetical protein
MFESETIAEIRYRAAAAEKSHRLTEPFILIESRLF